MTLLLTFFTTWLVVKWWGIFFIFRSVQKCWGDFFQFFVSIQKCWEDFSVFVAKVFKKCFRKTNLFEMSFYILFEFHLWSFEGLQVYMFLDNAFQLKPKLTPGWTQTTIHGHFYGLKWRAGQIETASDLFSKILYLLTIHPCMAQK